MTLADSAHALAGECSSDAADADGTSPFAIKRVQ